MTPLRWISGGVLLVLAACTPALDWREVRPVDSDAQALFPCKPGRHARTVQLAGAAVEMHLAACKAQDATYAVAYATLPEPAQVTPALDQLRRAAAANIGGTPAASDWTIAGMTPNPLTQKLVMQGRDPEGKAVQEQAVFFVRGLRVYQATIVGPVLDPAAVDTFFGGLRLVSPAPPAASARQSAATKPYLELAVGIPARARVVGAVSRGAACVVFAS
jgi:hypothetical protein